MKVISVMNLKGGVGKTTTAINMGAILARCYGQKVVLLDFDPQANLTAFFGMQNHGGTAFSLIAEDIDPAACTYQLGGEQIYVVPGDINLIMEDLAAITQAGGSARSFVRLGDTLDVYRAAGMDYVIIDCPPSFSAASVAAIYCSDEVIIPIKIDGFSIAGVAQLKAQIDALTGIRPSLGYGCLITMWHNVEVVREGCKAFLARYGDHVFQTHIRRSDMVDESTYAGETLDLYSPTSAAGRDYRAFVAEYLGRGEK